MKIPEALYVSDFSVKNSIKIEFFADLKRSQQGDFYFLSNFSIFFRKIRKNSAKNLINQIFGGFSQNGDCRRRFLILATFFKKIF